MTLFQFTKLGTPTATVARALTEDRSSTRLIELLDRKQTAQRFNIEHYIDIKPGTAKPLTPTLLYKWTRKG